MDRVGRVDMSSRAIDRRLREVAQLYRLGLSISRARSLGRPKEKEKEKEKGSDTGT